MPKLQFNKSNTFCISLAASLKRWKRMQDRLRKFNLFATRWRAATPNNLVDNFSSHLTDRQKACSQSHINIYRHMVKHRIPFSLILEDDAMFDKKWREKLQEVEPILEQDPKWHLVMLNASEPITPINQWVPQMEQYLTAGYIISLNGAHTILHWFQGCFYASDWMTSQLQLLGHSYSYFPWLIIQEGKYSIIQDKVPEEDYKKVVRCLNEIGYSMDNYI
jgi:GR25 family glycosyltransferase involved in LPS biosynthesis